MAPDSGVQDLVDGFARNISSLSSSETLEASIRNEFIDPFWERLGWDVRNVAQRSAAEKEVVVEARLGTVEERRVRTRRPDYLFRIGGFPRLIIEAKRAALDITEDKDAIFQAKAYAWSAQIPFAVLTNFKQFRLFDTTIKPYYDDPGRGVVRDFDLTFSDYPAQWDVLSETFSRRSVEEGSLETLLSSLKRVRKGKRLRGADRLLLDLRGTELVDQEFLANIERYRERFATAFFEENRTEFPDSETRHGAARLTEAAQRLLDRIVFIRVCEDREISPYRALRDKLDRVAAEGGDLYRVLVQYFRELDRSYNGYLFKPHFSEELTLPGEVLADFLRGIYPPESPYRFDAIGDDILGIIYERFLGNEIRVSDGKVQAEEKPEVRHAGGVYYTPRFVVDHIVRRVVGPRVEGLAPQEVLSAKILDPACGSGSFLIAAFQFLIDHCLHEIESDTDLALVPATPRARKKKKEIAFQDEEGTWHLSPDFRAQLLTSCLHGVDIDSQAVEVTIMSLYLKMLEGRLPANWQIDWIENQLLPPLDNNVRCGNSLVSHEEMDRWALETKGGLFEADEDTKFRINAFSWDSKIHGFGRVLESQGGFDCVIGNPPYIRVQELNEWAPEECEIYKWKYRSAASGSYDIYVVFIERALDLLSKHGVLGYICPHKYWQASYGKNLRGLLKANRSLMEIVDFRDQQVFRGATTYTAIQIFSNEENEQGLRYSRIDDLIDGVVQCGSISWDGGAEDDAHFVTDHPDSDGKWFFRPPAAEAVIEKASEGSLSLCPGVCRNIFQGIITGADEVFLSGDFRRHPSDEGIMLVQFPAGGHIVEIERDLLVDVVRRQGFEPFSARPDHVLLLPYDATDERLLGADEIQGKYPRAWSYLNQHREKLEGREKGKFRETWWQLSRAQNIKRWSGSKLMVPYMIDQLCAAWDDSGSFFVNVTTGGYGLELIPKAWDGWHYYLLGLLNSKLLDYVLRMSSSQFRGGYFPANKQFIQDLPIKPLDNESDRAVGETIAQLTERIVKRRSGSSASRGALSPREQREVESSMKQVDQLVLNLYGFDKEPW